VGLGLGSILQDKLEAVVSWRGRRERTNVNSRPRTSAEWINQLNITCTVTFLLYNNNTVVVAVVVAGVVVVVAVVVAGVVVV